MFRWFSGTVVVTGSNACQFVTRLSCPLKMPGQKKTGKGMESPTLRFARPDIPVKMMPDA